MGATRDLGTRGASFIPYGPGDAGFTSSLVDLLAEHDDALLAAYIDDEASVSYADLRDGLAERSWQALAHPVFFGSAITGAGVDALIAGLTELLPATEGDADGPASGTVFKIERGPSSEKIAYVRMFSGAVRARDRLQFGRECEGKVTAVHVFERGTALQRPAVVAGQIGKLWGLADIQIGDTLGRVPELTARRHFAPPTLETVIAPQRQSDGGALYVALAQLSEQDPLINLRKDDLRQELYVSLYGEVQKEVIQATLANDFDLDVEFRETTTICIERPISSGATVEVIAKEPNPFLATVGLRVEPAPLDAGLKFQIAQDRLGTLPLAFFTAVEDAVRETLRQGLYGWEVTDCLVTLTHTGYWARQSSAHGGFDKSMSSTAGDFRNLTALVLMDALQQAGTMVYEPMQRFYLESPADTFGAVLSALAHLGAMPEAPGARGTASMLEGEIPADRVHELRLWLPRLTHGEGVLECAFERYAPVQGTIPTRPRSDNNPLNRREYLLNLTRRV